MKRTAIVLFAVVVLAALAWAQTAQAPAEKPEAKQPAAATGKTLDGKQIFMAQGCTGCHSVSGAGITAKTKTGPDLSQVLASEPDDKKISAFLRREGEINGKKHMKAFTGTDEELGAVLAWLREQQKKS